MVQRGAYIRRQQLIENALGARFENNVALKFLGCSLGSAVALIGRKRFRIDGKQNLFAKLLLCRILSVVVHHNDLVDRAIGIPVHSVGGDFIRFLNRGVGGQVREGQGRLHVTIREVAQCLLAAGDDAHLSTRRLLLLRQSIDVAQHVAVEAAGQTAVRHNNHNKHVLNLVMLTQQRVLGATYTLGNVGQHFDHGFGVRRSRCNALTSAANLSCSNHFHGSRNLLRRRDGVDTPINVVKVGHRYLPYAVGAN